ncbi:hypothetical protein [Paractinoplanes brasiliensis]|nr:hypothetical protein [Actinoplanes brasiliensis]
MTPQLGSSRSARQVTAGKGPALGRRRRRRARALGRAQAGPALFDNVGEPLPLWPHTAPLAAARPLRLVDRDDGNSPEKAGSRQPPHGSGPEPSTVAVPRNLALRRSRDGARLGSLGFPEPPRRVGPARRAPAVNWPDAWRVLDNFSCRCESRGMSKTIAEKLLIKPNTTVWLSDPAHVALLTPMPEGVREAGALATASTAVLFVEDAASARKKLDEHRADLTKPAAFWVAYPKGNKADINRDTLWPIVADFDMRPCGQVAIDDRWSGLRFRPNREGEERFTGGAK